MSLVTGGIVGVEALLRLQDPAQGLVMPSRFIRCAEEHGYIGRLTTFALERIVQYCRGWQSMGPALTASVNLSAVGLSDLTWPDFAADLCHRNHVHPGNIIFELTESALPRDPTASLEIMTRLRLKGFQLSIDDFGTGYSSLEQLQAFPFQ